ncbi:MAG: ABC transporter ATP-binding protein [Acidobacteriota bacterium]
MSVEAAQNGFLAGARSLSRLLPYFRPYRANIVWGVLATLGTVGVSLCGPQLLRFAIDDLKSAITPRKLAFYAALVLAIAAIEGILRFLMRRILIGVSRDVEYDLRNSLFQKLLRLPRRFYDAHPTGDIMNRCSSDVNSVRLLLGPGVMYSINTVAMFALALAIMFRIDVRLTLLALAPLPISTIVVYFFARRIHSHYLRVQEYFSEVSVFLQETFSGIRLLRAYDCGDSRQAQFDRMMGRYVDMNRGLITTWGMFYPIMGALGGLGGVVVLLYGGSEVIAGRITLGSFVAFSIYLMMLVWPMSSAGWVLNLIQRGAVSQQRLNHIFDAPELDQSPAGPAGGAVEVELRRLSFAYPGERSDALRSVSFRIPAGSTVGIIGKVGCGKSTLAALLARVYDPPDGTVMVGGRDVNMIPLRELRQIVSLVPQDPFLFSETIAQNIRMGSESADLPSLLSTAGMDADIRLFPQGAETVVGERGIMLSGGQKQRVTIARALARQAPIIVFDDALSSVDVETEEEIMKKISELPGRHTLIIISHRISSIRRADAIVVMRDGEIAEMGSHEELMAAEGLYASMVQREEIEAELATM